MSDIIQLIAVKTLHESPFNPRRIFNHAALAELAESIKHEGVLQPLLVRPRVPALFQQLADAADTAACGHEVVFGHRRFRAAQLAGLEAVRCIVRTMTDEQARRAQIAENLQREDVHPIEEAEGFQALIDDHGMTADAIAEQVGKSRSYVYGRLKLTALCKEVRDACLAGEIGAEVGLLVARLRTEKLQAKALGYIRGKYLDMGDGGVKSFRQIRDLLNERFTLGLKQAMFDPEDEMLLPAAGNCITCPKRSGNAPEFEDVATFDGDAPAHRHSYLTHAGPDVCTDPDCFDAKKKAHLKREAAKLEEKGKVVIDGNKARAAIDANGRLKDGFVPIADVRDALKKAKDKRIDVLHIQDPRTGKVVQAVKQVALIEAGVQPVAVQKKPGKSGPDRWQLEQEQRERDAELETKARKAVLLQVRERIRATERSTFDLQVLALNALEEMEGESRHLLAELYDGADWDALYDRVAGEQMAANDLSLLMLDIALCYQVEVDAWDLERCRVPATALMEAAAHYGVDVAAIRAELAPPAAPKKPTAAKKKAAKPNDDGQADAFADVPLEA